MTKAGEWSRVDLPVSTSGAVAASAPRSIFITNDFPPRIGGAQSYYWGLIKTLDPSIVSVLAPAHPGAAAFDATHPYKVVRAASSILWPTPGLLRQASALAAEQEAQIVQLGHPLPAGLLGPMLKQRHGLPYVVFLGGSEVTIPATVPGLSAVLDHVLANASALFTVSDYTSGIASRETGDTVPVSVLRPPLPVRDYLPTDGRQAARMKRRLGIDGDLVVCLGRLVPRKGQDVLIDALALLREDCPRLHLALIGDGRMMTSLYDRGQRRGVGDRVHLTGALVDGAVREWLQAADLFASPVRTRWRGFEVEGFGIVFAEAALTGLPVITGRSGGAPESVVDRVTGVVVDGRSAAEVAGALAAFMDLSPERRRQMGERGRRLALARHTPDIVGERYRELLWRATAA